MNKDIVRADLNFQIQKPEGLFPELIEKAAERLRRKGIVGIINSPNGNQYEKLTKDIGNYYPNLGNAIYDPQNEIFVVKGQKIITAEGYTMNILGLEADSNIPCGKDITETIKLAKKKHVARIASNIEKDREITESNRSMPVPKTLSEFLFNNPSLIVEFNGIEINYKGRNGFALVPYNFSKLSRANVSSQTTAQIQDITDVGAIASSEGTSIKELGTSYSFIPMPKDYSSIKNGRDLSLYIRYGIRESQEMYAVVPKLKIHQPSTTPLDRFKRLTSFISRYLPKKKT